MVGQNVGCSFKPHKCENKYTAKTTQQTAGDSVPQSRLTTHRPQKVRTPDLPAHSASCYAIPTSEQDEVTTNLLISHFLDRATPYNCVIKMHFSLFIPMNQCSTCFEQINCSSSGGTYCMCSIWCLSCMYVDWLLTRSEWNSKHIEDGFIGINQVREMHLVGSLMRTYSYISLLFIQCSVTISGPHETKSRMYGVGVADAASPCSWPVTNHPSLVIDI